MDSHLRYPFREGDIHALQPATDRDTNAPAKNLTTPTPARSITNGTGGTLPGQARPSSNVGEQLVKFADVAALFARRELKIYGGQISDTGSEMSNSSLSKQMDQGLQEGCSESELFARNLHTR